MFSGPARRTSQGNEVRTIRVADHTGSINMSVWNEIGAFATPGDIFRLRNGSTTVFKGRLALNVGINGEMLKTGEFLLAYNELPDKSMYNPELEAKYPHRKGSPEEESESAAGAGTSGNSSGGGPGFTSRSGTHSRGGGAVKRPQTNGTSAAPAPPTKIANSGMGRTQLR